MKQLVLLLGFVSSVATAVEPPYEFIFDGMKPPGPAAYLIIHNDGLPPPSGYTITWPGGTPEKPAGPMHQRLAIGMTCDWFDIDASNKTKVLIKCMRNPPTLPPEEFGPPRGECPADFGPAALREPWPSCKGKGK